MTGDISPFASSGKESNVSSNSRAPPLFETEPVIPGDVTNTPFAIYISGSDTRSNMLTVSRSDVNILVVVNPVTKQILLINTPRDYYVENPEGERNNMVTK